jgi:hypothetical protein
MVCHGKFINNNVCSVLELVIQGDLRVIMCPTELKRQPTIRLERTAGYGRGKYPASPSKCIVGCIFNLIGLIIICESPCMCK